MTTFSIALVSGVTHTLCAGAAAGGHVGRGVIIYSTLVPARKKKNGPSLSLGYSKLQKENGVWCRVPPWALFLLGSWTPKRGGEEKRIIPFAKSMYTPPLSSHCTHGPRVRGGGLEGEKKRKKNTKTRSGHELPKLGNIPQKTNKKLHATPKRVCVGIIKTASSLSHAKKTTRSNPILKAKPILPSS